MKPNWRGGYCCLEDQKWCAFGGRIFQVGLSIDRDKNGRSCPYTICFCWCCYYSCCLEDQEWLGPCPITSGSRVGHNYQATSRPSPRIYRVQTHHMPMIKSCSYSRNLRWLKHGQIVSKGSSESKLKQIDMVPQNKLHIWPHNKYEIAPQCFLATLVALHLTPVSKWVSE